MSIYNNKFFFKGSELRQNEAFVRATTLGTSALNWRGDEIPPRSKRSCQLGGGQGNNSAFLLKATELHNSFPYVYIKRDKCHPTVLRAEFL